MDVKIGNKDVSVWSLLLILGGLIAFIGMFLDNVIYTIDLGFLGSESEGITALDLLEGVEDYENLTFLSYFPFLIGIFGLLELLCGVLPMFVKGIDKVFVIGGAVLALLAVIMAIWFFISGFGPGLFADEFVKNIIEAADPLSAGVGFYFALIGSIIALIGGALNLKEAL